MPWIGDQGSTPQCVAYAWLGFLHDSPTTYSKPPIPLIPPKKLYQAAQAMDEWPGEDYEGSSVRGGIKALISLGYKVEYRWATTLNQCVQTILESGPMVVGTDWYEGMNEPNRKGFVSPIGEVLGGHAYVLSGVNTSQEFFRIQNSWGRTWGNNGCAKISFFDFRKLLADQGEACIAMEI